jgi:hypothetical protein
MNVPLKISTYIIKNSFHLSVWTIEQFYDIAEYEQRARLLKTLPEGTLGRDIADCLERNNLRLVPKFESHDLKHILLDFKMTPVDEIRLQAFMLGNGNYSLASFAIFAFGVLLLPDLWTTFYRDFKNGRNTKPISHWTIEEYAHCKTSTLRECILNYNSENRIISDMKSLAKTGAVSAITAGILGMLFCIPHLFSSSIIDLVGAGFPFVGGAILAGAGLISMTRLIQSESEKTIIKNV